MAKALTAINETRLDIGDARRSITITLNTIDITSYVKSYNYQFSTEFSIASLELDLINNNGIFLESGTNAIYLDDEIVVTESFEGTSDVFVNFTGYVKQRRKTKTNKGNFLSLMCLDLLVKLEDTDIEHNYEATKVAIKNESLKTNPLEPPNEVLSQIFDFANKNIAEIPPPEIIIEELATGLTAELDSGYDIYFETGQVRFGTAYNSNLHLMKASYYYYPKSLYIEDILEDIIAEEVDGYGNSLFGESSESNVITNHLTASYLEIEKTSIDTLVTNSSTQTITIDTVLTASVVAAATFILVADTSGFPSTGTGDINGETFTWTSKTATTLVGIVTSAHAIGSYAKYKNSYVAGRVWYLSYSNLITDLVESNFTIPGATIDYIDKRQGRIILNTAINVLATVTCNVNYTFKTIQSTGVQINNIRFSFRKDKTRLDAFKKLKEFLPPNYVFQTLGDKKIWGRYLTQKSTADFTLKCKTSLDFSEDTSIYTRTKFYGQNENPTNICWQPGLSSLITGEDYTATVNNQDLTWKRKENDFQVYIAGAGIKGITTTTFQPRVRVNGVLIDDKVHEVLFQPIINEARNVGYTGKSNTIPLTKYYWHFAHKNIDRTKHILIYDSTGSPNLWYPDIAPFNEWKTTVSIRHIDNTETILGTILTGIEKSNLVIGPANTPLTISNSWTCPATNLTITDAIKIKEELLIDGSSRSNATWITEQLNQTEIKSSVWVFLKNVGTSSTIPGDNPLTPVTLMLVSIRGEDTRPTITASLYWGSTDKETKVSGIDYTGTDNITYYYRQDSHTINGSTANQLKTTNTNISNSISATQQIVHARSYAEGWVAFGPNQPTDNNAIITAASTASYWVRWSLDLLVIDFEKGEFKISKKLVSDSGKDQVSVTADFEYRAVVEDVDNASYIIDGRWGTQAQTVFWSKPAAGFIFIRLDLGDTYNIQTIDLVAGFFRPNENPDVRLDFTNTYSLQYSLDNITYYDVCRKAKNFQLTAGQAISFELEDLGENFQAKYLQIVIEDMSKITWQTGCWVAAFTDLACYSDMILTGEALLTPYTTLNESYTGSVTSGAGTTVNLAIDDTSTFSNYGIAYLDEIPFSYGGKNTSNLLQCSGAGIYSAQPIGTIITQNLQTSGADTYLTQISSTDDTTLNVNSTVDFLMLGTAYVEKDTFNYTGLTSTSFIGCSGLDAHGKFSKVIQRPYIYDTTKLLRMRDKVYKDTSLNEYLSTQKKVHARSYNWLREVIKDHSKCSTTTIYGPHYRPGMTVRIIDTTNNIDARFFIEAIQVSADNISHPTTLTLAKYP